ncbi:Rossmann-like and DUF2520 domain-containing protein [Microbacterium cremeum]|uniref:Rossmann-like and DUF2520 domain-containing protein n=1 Tax=Microbacterium cremeum TaxID=2782169 RepID=UPI001888C69C|nr:Rossmann-like and DUF2520 domain-containing protein [Microbacterium cremeum]
MPDRDPHSARAEGREATIERVAIVGDGRVGRAVAAALTDAGIEVCGPLRRDASTHGEAVVLLAVPDAEIAAAAALVAPATLVGHFSGATTLEPLAEHDGFSIHPLTTITGAGAAFDGLPAAVAGSSDRALAAATALARAVGMRPFEVADDDRAAYHAAASIASNFLLTLESFAEDLAASAGVRRDAFATLVRATVDNWQRDGAAASLTGPIARGDEATVARQRAAVAERTPDRLGLFDALAAATRELAARPASRAGADETRSEVPS